MMSIKLIRILVLCFAALAILSTFFPWHSLTLRNSSQKQADQGNYAQALHLAERAVSYNPFSVDALFILASNEHRLGRSQTARSKLIKAVELEPSNYLTWEQLATYERDAWGEPEEAKNLFEKAVSLNPADEELKKRAAEGQN